MTYRPICITGVAGSGKDTFSLHLMAAAIVGGVHPVVVALGDNIKRHLGSSTPDEWVDFSNYCHDNHECQSLAIRAMKISDCPLQKDEPSYRPLLEAWGLRFWREIFSVYKWNAGRYLAPLICVRPCQPEEIDFWRKRDAYWVHIQREGFAPVSAREEEWDKEWRALADKFVINRDHNGLAEDAQQVVEKIYKCQT